MLVTGDDGASLYEVDVSNGAATIVGAGNTNNQAWGGTLDTDGRFLLPINNGRDLGFLDRVTGQETLIAANNFGARDPFAMEVDPRTGILYGGDFGTDEVITIDKTSGNATLLGNAGAGIDFFLDFSFAPDGALWASAVTGGGAGLELFTIDLNTGAATSVTTVNLPPGVGAGSVGSLAFAQNGDLFALEYVANGPLYQIDTSTGDMNLVANTGINSPWGGDIDIIVSQRSTPNSAPTISSIPDQTVFGESVLGPIPFTVDDLQTNANSLRVAATSSNQNLIEDRNILLTGSGNNRSLLITNIGRTGTFADITVTVVDSGGAVARRTFSVTSFSGPSIVVDNLSPGFVGGPGWHPSAATDAFRETSLVSNFGGVSASFAPPGIGAGDYRIFAWWAAELPGGRRALRSTSVDFVVHHNGTSDRVRMDQSVKSGEWIELGTFTFAGTGSENVTLVANPGLPASADAVAFVGVANAGNVGDVFVDNLDAGFTASAGWDESGVVKEFNDSSLSTFSPTATASWTPSFPEAGNYEVFIWLSREIRGGRTISRGKSVEYAIEHSGRTTNVAVDQNAADSGGWTALGTFAFDASGGEKVTLLPGSAGYGTGSVGADAVRFSPIVAGRSVDLIVDNLDAGFAVSGNWSESAALDEFNGSSFSTLGSNQMAKWSFPGSEAGRYQVFVWSSAALGGGRAIRRTENARFVIQHGGQDSLVVVDQNDRPGQWVSIGEFSFSAVDGEGVSVISSGVSTAADAVRFVKIE